MASSSSTASASRTVVILVFFAGDPVVLLLFVAFDLFSLGGVIGLSRRLAEEREVGSDVAGMMIGRIVIT